MPEHVLNAINKTSRRRGSLPFGFALVMTIHVFWVTGFQIWFNFNKHPAEYLSYPPPVLGLAVAQFFYVGPLVLFSAALLRWKTVIGYALGAVVGGCVTALIIAFDPLI